MLDGFSLGRNGASLLVTAAAALVAVEVVKLLSKASLLSSYTSRKLLHVAVGLIYFACWPRFSEDSTGLLFCAAVPLAITLQFTVIGAGLYSDEATVKMMSRTGKRQELLLGPLTCESSFRVKELWSLFSALHSLPRSIRVHLYGSLARENGVGIGDGAEVEGGREAGREHYTAHPCAALNEKSQGLLASLPYRPPPTPLTPPPPTPSPPSHALVNIHI